MYDIEYLESIMAILGGFLIVVAVILLAWVIFYIIGMWKLYVKMGQPGWKVLIPFYNSWTLVEMAGLNWYWFLLLIADFILNYFHMSTLGSIIVIFANINICYNLHKKFNKSQGWFILSIFFNSITLPLLGYSSNDQVDSSVFVSPNGIFDAKNTTNGSANNGPVNNGAMNNDFMNNNVQGMSQQTGMSQNFNTTQAMANSQTSNQFEGQNDNQGNNQINQ